MALRVRIDSLKRSLVKRQSRQVLPMMEMQYSIQMVRLVATSYSRYWKKRLHMFSILHPVRQTIIGELMTMSRLDSAVRKLIRSKRGHQTRHRTMESSTFNSQRVSCTQAALRGTWIQVRKQMSLHPIARHTPVLSLRILRPL